MQCRAVGGAVVQCSAVQWWPSSTSRSRVSGSISMGSLVTPWLTSDPRPDCVSRGQWQSRSLQTHLRVSPNYSCGSFSSFSFPFFSFSSSSWQRSASSRSRSRPCSRGSMIPFKCQIAIDHFPFDSWKSYWYYWYSRNIVKCRTRSERGFTIDAQWYSFLRRNQPEPCKMSKTM